jgi:hypothetical protein
MHPENNGIIPESIEVANRESTIGLHYSKKYFILFL